MAKKKEKNEAWSRQESFVREIERDTKEKSEQVLHQLAQAERNADHQRCPTHLIDKADGNQRKNDKKAQHDQHVID